MEFQIEASNGYNVVSDFAKPIKDYIKKKKKKMYAHKKARRVERQ